MSVITSLLEGRLGDNIVLTNKNIALEMINILPENIWNKDTTFLDPVCKSGVFLEVIYEKLMQALERDFEDKAERHNHILNNQLFGLCELEMRSAITRRRLYGSISTSGNIVTNRNLKNIVKGNFETYKNYIKEAFGDMKFDVVIGNPPYNRGMDLDFVYKGFQICRKYCVMITPAKWQTAEAEQRTASKISYGEFRDKLVKHMSKVVFYPDCKDVFDIYQIDGISYYVLDKCREIDKCTVENISKTRGNVINSVVNRSIRQGESLVNICNEITSYMGTYKKFKFPYLLGNKAYNVVTNTQASGYDWFIEYKPRFLLGISRILDIGAGEKHEGLSKVTFESDNKSDCESFISWINTRFTRFFILANVSKLTVLDQHCFRFVPAPPSGKFDHIYTDEELYKAFNLPQKYIDVIEAVIKERN